MHIKPVCPFDYDPFMNDVNIGVYLNDDIRVQNVPTVFFSDKYYNSNYILNTKQIYTVSRRKKCMQKTEFDTNSCVNE